MLFNIVVRNNWKPQLKSRFFVLNYLKKKREENKQLVHWRISKIENDYILWLFSLVHFILFANKALVSFNYKCANFYYTKVPNLVYAGNLKPDPNMKVIKEIVLR